MTQQAPLRAHMIRSWDGTEWQIFVALPDEARWPHVPFPIAAGIPTLNDRAAALRSLGFTPLGAEQTWEWMETVFEGDPDGVVSLVATTTVTPGTAPPA
ncbi:DUF6303 family protein [Streptomyces sp. NBC_01477]|uniref:DUF6303 family protein n=1 Tax=Streptomyces sp. NBC_01477 TaxID=2976015 RepID=UPI002E3211EC|nr:DUF6303 family protein [Streptomyces sp. NBC_01477]